MVLVASPKVVTQGRIDGLVLASVSETEELAESLTRAGLPWLMLNGRPETGRRFVAFDDEGAAVMAVNHLLALGHTRIAHVGGPAAGASSARRRAGYERALLAAGLDSEGATIIPSDHTEEAGAAAMNRYLAGPDRPTAIFAANALQAIGALHAARRAGLRVPAELSIVAIHDLRPAAYVDPPLTTVRMPLERLGRRAVEVLERSAPDDVIEEVVPEPMELVVRASTALAPS